MGNENGRVQTIEMTAKRLKLHKVLAIAITAAGLLALVCGLRADPDNQRMIVFGWSALIFGSFWRVVVSVQTWWNHA